MHIKVGKYEHHFSGKACRKARSKYEDNIKLVMAFRENILSEQILHFELQFYKYYILST
jgi:hypothetical protein